MHSCTAVFAVDAPPHSVWRVLHPPAPSDATPPRVIQYPARSIEILSDGDEAGQGMVRTCVFDVPRYLLSNGKARSWEVVTDPILRTLLERVVHQKISADNLSTYEHAPRYAGPARRLP